MCSGKMVMLLISVLIYCPCLLWFLTYRSISGLKNLKRLDVGNNEIEELVSLVEVMYILHLLSDLQLI